jgi:hypothetical protein
MEPLSIHTDGWNVGKGMSLTLEMSKYIPKQCLNELWIKGIVSQTDPH